MVDSHELQSGSLMLVGVYKLTDCSALYQVNAGELYADLVFDDATLYVNPFMVVTPQGYTKHYYIGSQHIAAQTGYTAFMPNVVVSENNSSEYVQLAQNLLQTQMEMYESSETQEPDEIPYLDIDGQDASELQPLCTDDMQVVEVGYSMTSNRIYSLLSHNYLPDANSDPEIYYYHSDHLGSATWITDFSGAPIQYVHYLPYGETYLNQHGSTYDERYKFTGKERDIETGYDYFGARYYSSALSSWLSPDPLMDKYPSISPYAYCNWNPMKYVDPDGKDAIYITFPQYKANGIPHTGHAGVLLINNQNGLTKYYEYGRYDKEKLGITRNLKIPDVKLKDGKPTYESLNKVLRSISKQAGHNGNIEGAYVKSDNFTKMDSYAKDKIQENNDPQRKPYNIITNNCATFAEDVILQDETIEKPWILIHTPINTVSEYQKNGNAKINYNSKTDDTSW